MLETDLLHEGTGSPKRPRTERRLPSLDGLRAVSIVLVLLGHVSGTRGAGVINLQIGNYAHLGVVVFFVISGFLITSLLMAEYESHGRVSLRLFFARRSLRILPAMYLYLVLLCALWMLGLVHLTNRDLWHALTYTVNFEPGHAWQVGHLWSLSVEEQFYLLWPLAFVYLRPQRATWAALGVVFVAIVARVGNRYLLIGTPFHDLEMFPMVADSLAMGCLLARGRGWLEEQSWYLRMFRPQWSLLILATVLLLNRYEGYTLVTVFGMLILNAGVAILIHRSVYHSEDVVGRALNWRPVAFVGVLSYSLYVWQQPLLNRTSSAWINAFPQNILLAIGAGLVSYSMIEKPLLKLRHRLRARSAAPPVDVPEPVGPECVASGAAVDYDGAAA